MIEEDREDEGESDEGTKSEPEESCGKEKTNFVCSECILSLTYGDAAHFFFKLICI